VRLDGYRTIYGSRQAKPVFPIILGSLSNHDGDADGGQRRLNNELIFYLRISQYSKVIYFVYHCQNYLKTESGTQRSIRNRKFKKNSRRGSRSPDNAEFGHFTLLFCRGRQRNESAGFNPTSIAAA